MSRADWAVTIVVGILLGAVMASLGYGWWLL